MPFDVVQIDLVQFPKSINGNIFAVTIMCELTKYLVISPIPNKESKTVAKALRDDFILHYGFVKTVKSDNGKEFAEVFSELNKLLAIDHVKAASDEGH